MHALRILLLALAAFVIGLTGNASTSSADVTDQQVREAIRKGVQALYNSQGAWGHWDTEKKGGGGHAAAQYGGTTSLACYALLTAGEEWQQNPKLQKPLEFLAAQNDMNGSYAVGLRAHVWPKLPDQFLGELKEDAYLLVQGINSRGGYHYKLGASSYDNSCTQYGALGAWECAKRGVPIPNSYWQKLQEHFIKGQSSDGGWAYVSGRNSNLTMTSAGLAVMYITLDYLNSGDFIRPGITQRHPVYSRILKGLDAFEKHFSVTTNGYAAVGIERVGLASGRKFFKGKDWYQEIATRYVKAMGPNGVGGGRGAVVETSFALVFLSRGRVPVFANKLEIPDYDWDNRPRDLANVTQWASDEFEVALNWQIVGMNSNPELWLDSAVLYLASHRPLELNEDQKNKLRRYIDLGGTLVINPDGGDRRFIRSVIDTFEGMYPYKFEDVGLNDDIYSINYHVERDQSVKSLNNGVRHLVLVLGKDAGADWQTNRQRDPSPWYLMANIFQYAIEKSQPRARLEQHVDVRDGKADNTIHIARASYDGNWNAEPLAWDRTDVFAVNAGKASMKTHRLDLAQIAGQDVSMVHVSGTDAVAFSDEQIEAIRQFVNKDGGVMLFESVGGKPEFNSSVIAMLRRAFPDAAQLPRRLGVTDDLISGQAADGSYDVSRVDYRLYYKQRLGATTRPGLQAIFVDGKPKVLISAEDLSVGALGQPVWGVFGYDSESARKILTNIALFAAVEKPASGKIGNDPADEEQAEEVAAE